MKHILIFVTFLSIAGSSYAVDYDSVIHVIADRTKPFDERYMLLNQHLGYLQAEQGFTAMMQLAAESKKLPDMDKTINLYSTLLHYLCNFHEFNLATMYLDSVLMFEMSADNLNRAKINLAVGVYYAELAQMEQAHEYYYRALANYEKTGEFQREQIALLYNIAITYIHEKDSASLKDIIERMKPLAEKVDDFPSFININTVIASYYGVLYELDEQQIHYADSVLLYDLNIIQRYESMEDPPVRLALHVAYNYLRFAEFSLYLPNPDWDAVIQYVEKAVAMNHDTYSVICYHCVYACYHLKMNHPEQALTNAREALRLLLEIDNEGHSSLHASLYELLSQIHEERKEYGEALKYERLRTEAKFKIYNNTRHQIVKNLQTRYEVEKKDEDIRHLTEENRYRANINRLYLGMLVLIALVCIFVILWFRGKRKADAGKLQITKLQSYLEGLESERSRLAKELHDHVSNGLLALNYQMQSSGVPVELAAMAEKLHGQVREISHTLIPPVFLHASLPEIIDEYVREQNRLEGPCFQFYLDPEEGWENLPHPTALDLYRIVQEACGNAIKHARAKNVVISLSREEKQTILSITDDGAGFQTEEVTKGIGLQTINERAASQNGTLTIESTPGKGSAIQLRIEN